MSRAPSPAPALVSAAGPQGDANTSQSTDVYHKAGSKPSLLEKTTKKASKRKPALSSVHVSSVQEVDADKLELVTLVYESKRCTPVDDLGCVKLSKAFKGSHLALSDDQLSVTGRKGYRSARANHGVHEGTFYCEVLVAHLGSTGHCRLGWCTKKADVQTPVGYDVFGFSYRDLEGSKVHNGKREPYADPYKEGDVIGLWIHLPPGGRPLEQKGCAYTRWKGKWARIEEPEPEPNALMGSLIGFSKNGVFQGVAYTDFSEGTYYPAASLYTLPEQKEGAKVTFNFGPSFQFKPPEVDGCPPAMPLSEVASAAKLATPLLSGQAVEANGVAQPDEAAAVHTDVHIAQAMVE